jgi:hypothetical protein
MELANILEVSVKEDKENRLPLRNHINFSRYYFYLKEIFGNDEMLIGDIFHYLKHQILFLIFLDWVVC